MRAGAADKEKGELSDFEQLASRFQEIPVDLFSIPGQIQQEWQKSLGVSACASSGLRTMVRRFQPAVRAGLFALAGTPLWPWKLVSPR